MKKRYIFLIFLLCAVYVFGMADRAIAAQVLKKENERKAALERRLQLKIRDNDYDAKVGGESAYEELRDIVVSSRKGAIYVYIDMMHTNTTVYLDELLKHEKVGDLTVKNGGFITVKNRESINDNRLYHLEFYHVNHIEGDILSGLNDLHKVYFCLDERFEGYGTLAELCSQSDCENIIMEYEDDDSGSLMLRELAVQMPEKEYIWQKLMRVEEEENRHLGAVYQLNIENDKYTSYEFYENGVDRDEYPHVFLVIEEKDAGTGGDSDILEIKPGESPEMGSYGDKRIYLEDLNFDGHEDIIFTGDNVGYDLFQMCVIFLWNPHIGRYERNKTAPVHFSHIDEKRKRLTDTLSMSAFDDTYYIYEYRNGIFYEKSLRDQHIIHYPEETVSVKWDYWENGELMERLVWKPEINDGENYTFYRRDGKVFHGFFTDDEGDYSDLGQQFFPDFDFYAFG